MTITAQPPVETDQDTNTLRILDSNGDTLLRWRPTDAVEVETARQAFQRERARGALAYRTTNGGRTQGEVIREFDPQAREIIMTPQMQGG